jgi:ATP synthase subunit 6
MYFGLFFFFNGPFVQANIIKYDNAIYKDYFSVSGDSNIFFHKDSFFVSFDYLANFYKKKIFAVSNTIKSSDFSISLISFVYKQASIATFLNNKTLNSSSTNGHVHFYSLFLDSLKNKSAAALCSNTSEILLETFLKNRYIQNKRTSLSSISADNNRVTTSFLRHIILVSFFFKKFISNIYVVVFQGIYGFALKTVTENFCASNLKKSLQYFPFFFSIFTFLLFLNCIGLIPYSATMSGYLSVTLFLTFVVLFGAYFLVFSLHGLKFFGLFVPQGCPFALIFFIIPIEFVSYVFRMVSLSARLFANMMAGHALLAVLAGFSWTMFNSYDVSIMLLGLGPMIVVFLLFFLETGVAIVQAVVFTILSCMYIDEAVNLSH